MTLIVVPGDTLNFHIRYDQSKIDKDRIDWIKTNLKVLFENLADCSLVSDLIQLIDSAPEPILQTNESVATAYLAPGNEMEQKLAVIWAGLFGKTQIGVADNFFEIGGNSILAVQLFAQIEKQMGINLPPVVLLKHNTIAALAEYIAKKEWVNNWSIMVPLRTQGSRLPLFCIHAKGGHVLFYEELVKYLDPDQPVYAIQPRGLDGISPKPQTMEEMAEDYLQEMRKIQPEGPYFIIGIVGFEIARQIRASGDKLGMLIVLDTAPYENKGGSVNQKRLRKLLDWIRKGQWHKIGRKIKSKLGIKQVSTEELSVEKMSTIQEQRLKKIQEDMRDLAINYDWAPQDISITLVRSEEMVRRPDKKFHVPVWQKLGTAPMDTFTIPVEHWELVKEKGAKILGPELQKRIDAHQKL